MELARPPVEPRHRIAGKLLERDARALCERVVARDCHGPRLTRQDGADHEIRLLQREPAGDQVDGAAAKRHQRVVPRQLGDVDLALRMERAERVDDPHQVRAFGRPAEHAEPQCPRKSSRGVMRVLERSRELAVRRAHLVEEPLSERDELNVAARSVNQLSSELVSSSRSD
jgi:hypothetical protein